jgi:hypothetical protein
MLIAADFIQELYVHMGFHPAWKYRSVFEMIFSEGHLTEWHDVSEQIAAIRDRMQDRPGGPDGSPHSRQEIDEWIAGTFRLDYDLGV